MGKTQSAHCERMRRLCFQYNNLHGLGVQAHAARFYKIYLDNSTGENTFLAHFPEPPAKTVPKQKRAGSQGTRAFFFTSLVSALNSTSGHRPAR